MSEPREALIRAAGGVVWENPRRRRLAVVFRDRYVADECCLPKGKLDPGEGWEEAAQREVLEEAGCDARILRIADVLPYSVSGVSKVVVYFEMVALWTGQVQDPDEVTRVEWMPVDRALSALTHMGERRVVRECLAREAVDS